MRKTSTESLLSRVKFTREINGYYSAIGMSGTPEDIQSVYMLLVNSGVTSGELLDLGAENFAYVWVQPENWVWFLAKWEIETLAFNNLLPKRDKLTASRSFLASRAKWLRKLERMPRENFVPCDASFTVSAAHAVGVADGMVC